MSLTPPSLSLLGTILLGLCFAEARAQDSSGLRLESLHGEVAAACSSSGWRPLALGERSAAPLRLSPGAEAEFRHREAQVTASLGARFAADEGGLRLERGRLVIRSKGPYRVATRLGGLTLGRGQLEVAALTSGVFARAAPHTRAAFEPEEGPRRQLAPRWTRLEPWKIQRPGFPAPPRWPELPVALRDIHGIQAERIQVVGLEARVELDSGLARSEWRLTLRSPEQERIEAVTPLPLPLGAAVTNLWVGEPRGPGAKVIAGRSRNRGLAVGGEKQLAHLEWSRGDIARLSVAPVTTEVTITLQTVQALPCVADRYRFALPLGRPAWRGLERVRCELWARDLGALSSNRPLRRGERDGRQVLVYAFERAARDLAPAASAEDLVVWANSPALDTLEMGREVLTEGEGANSASLIRLRTNLFPVQVHPDRVFLVDTALAPTPEAFAARVLALETLLDELPDQDTFAVLAYDATVAPLTPGFVRGAAAKRRALAALRARGSLGASDLEGVLLAAEGLCRQKRAGQLVLVSGGPPSFGELRAKPLARVARERFEGWSISALALGELRSEAHLEAIVGGRGLVLAASSRGAGAAAFRLAHSLEFLEGLVEVGVAGRKRERRVAPPGGQIVFWGPTGEGQRALEFKFPGSAPRRLELPSTQRAAGVSALLARRDSMAEPHRELLKGFRREVRGEIAPTTSAARVRVLLPQAALSAGSERYAIWSEFVEPLHDSSSEDETVDPRSDGDPLWGLDLDRLVSGRLSARIAASVYGALALEVYYRVERATEGKADEDLAWPKEQQHRAPLGEPSLARVPVAALAPPPPRVLHAQHPDLHVARRRGVEIESELAAPPEALEALYLERAPRRASYSECGTPHWHRRYLVRVANPDGSWGSPPSLALTSRTLLAFVGSGHTHRFGTFKRRVSRGYLWLKRRQRPDGGFGESLREHAVASSALFELYLVSRDFKLREPVTRALSYLLAQQNADGSWGQGAARPRASVEAVRVLKRASLAKGLEEAPGLAKAWSRVGAYLASITSPDGAVGPRGLPRGDEIDLTLTAEVALARVFAGTPAWDPQIRGAGAHLLTLTKGSAGTWYRERFPQDGYRILWAGTELMFQLGASAWPTWVRWMQQVLLPHQVVRGHHDGSWNPPGAAARATPGDPPGDLPRLLASPVLRRQGEATSAALTSLCAALARVEDRAQLERWRESERLPPASRGCAGARLALSSELRGEPLAAAEDWFRAWQGAGQSPAADPFLLRASALWERERGGGYALLRVLAAPCRQERFGARVEVLLDVLLRQPERARRELIRGLPTRRPFERRVRVALIAALTGLEQDPIRQVALLENLAALVGRSAPWERLATAYLAVGDPRGLELRRALVEAGQQDRHTLARLRADAIEHLPVGEARQRAVTSELQVHWAPSDQGAGILDSEFAAGAGLDLRLAALELPHFAQSDLAAVLEALQKRGRSDPVELALALVNGRNMTFEHHEERRLRGIHFDESPALQAALERVLENDLEVVVAWENEESEVEFRVEDLQGSRISGVVEEEEGRVLFLVRREAALVRVRVELPQGSPATRVHLKISQRRAGKRSERRWVFKLEKGSAARSLAD
jgi:VWA domain-containing protein/prenyltransferase/squalene oxidase-like repeat protein